ncbi:MAG: hypothetical protein HQK84_12360 [Nitrospinae bacterium]|nr:hypothetical protein [Nitrospinota bacterium]
MEEYKEYFAGLPPEEQEYIKSFVERQFELKKERERVQTDERIDDIDRFAELFNGLIVDNVLEAGRDSELYELAKKLEYISPDFVSAAGTVLG